MALSTAVLVLKWLLKTLMCSTSTSTVLKTKYIMIYAAQPGDIFIWIELAAVFTAFI